MNRDSRQVLTEWLVLAAQRGDESAFRDLHQLWQGDLRRMTQVRVERPEVADEVLTDVWLAIARNLWRLDEPACFPRWAFQIVVRRCADWIKKRSRARRQEVALAREADELAPAAPDSSPPEEHDDRWRLRAAIAQLPPEQRELLHLYYERECGIAEIAEVLAIPPGTVKSRLFSVRENLKRLFERKSP